MDKLDGYLEKYVKVLLTRYPGLACIQRDIILGYLLLEETFKNGNKLLIAGNGGSAADAEHMVGELMKSFRLSRTADNEFVGKLLKVDKEMGRQLAENLQGGLPAMALSNHPALTSAYLNDVEGTQGYAQQVYGYGKKGDLYLGISTSGNSRNILYGAVAAKAMGIKVLGLTGELGGRLKEFSDVIVAVPEKETYIVQEYHLPIYHCWCLMLEERFFAK